MKALLLLTLTLLPTLAKADSIENYLMCSEYNYHLNYLQNETLAQTSAHINKLYNLKTVKLRCTYLSQILDPIDSKLEEQALEANTIAKYFNTCSNLDENVKREFTRTAVLINQDVILLNQYKETFCN